MLNHLTPLLNQLVDHLNVAYPQTHSHLFRQLYSAS